MTDFLGPHRVISTLKPLPTTAGALPEPLELEQPFLERRMQPGLRPRTRLHCEVSDAQGVAET